MKFNDLDTLIPKVPADRRNLHTNTMYVSGGFGWSVRAKWPGKHKESSGDFVVETLSEGAWDEYKQFTHSDLFQDIVAKSAADEEYMQGWLHYVLAVVKGDVPVERQAPYESSLPGIHIDALANSIQALTVCEFRRFPQGDIRGGGRYLPINFMLAILGGHLTLAEAESGMRRGWPVLRDLDGFMPFHKAHSPDSFAIKIDTEAVRLE